MMQKLYWVPLACMTGLVCGTVQAADMRLRPGLWEITMHTMHGGAMQQMPKLSPQQQAQMEKMGIKMPAAGGMIMQTCLTREQVERDEPPKPRDDARQKCEQTDFQRAGNTVRWKMSCSGEHPMSGSGSMTMQSPEAYSSTMDIVSKDPRMGGATSNKTTGRWLQADCPRK